MAEKRIKRKLVWEDAGVSEIIGTILMLSITVVMFSGIITFVGNMPAPQESFNVEVDCDLVPNDPDDWYNGGVKFRIQHQGGKAMDPMWINIFITVNNTMLKYNLDDGFQLDNTDYDDDGWLGVGENWVVNIYNTDGPVFQNSTYSITIIHQEKNLLVWQETLGKGHNFYSPVIVDAWIDSDLATPEVDDPGPISYIDSFKIYVRILDPEGFDAEQGLDRDNLWVNLSSIYGDNEPPVQLFDWVDDRDSINDDIYVSECTAPNRSYAPVGYHYFHFNASDNAGLIAERHILFPVGMIVGENPQVVVRGNNVDTGKYEYIWFSDPEPVNGDATTIYATIQNLGGGSAQVDVDFYDGEVDESLKIGTYYMLLHAQGERDASVDWIASPGGNHTIIVTAKVNATYALVNDVYDPDLTDNQNDTTISVMPKILLVDDDGHLNDLTDGDTVSFMRASLEAADFEYDFISVGAGDGPGYDYGDYPLEDYDLVVWMTGHTEVNTLTRPLDPGEPMASRTDDVANLMRFLDGESTGGNGGSLWLISEGYWDEAIGDVVHDPFYKNYLHLSDIATTPQPTQKNSLPAELWGKDNHPITEYYADKPIHTEEKVTGTDAAWSWDFGDFPDTNVIALNNSDNSRVFGVTYDSDDYPADTITDSRIFVQTWDFSRIEDTATQAQYTYKAIMWLGNITMKYTQDIAISEQTIYPKSVFFKQNVTISFVVRNNGFAPYNFSQGDNLWYLLRITDMNGNDLIVPHLERIDYLGVGVNNTLTLSYSWTPEQIGYHRIVIKVDPYNYIEESNELNNEISSYLASGELFVQYRILVVDDDGSPNNGGIFVNETLEVETAMEYLNATGLYRYENYTVNVGSDGPAFAPGTNGAGLSEYNAVIWVGGEELDPLTAMDMLNITYYLDIGGNFWLIGNGLWTDADEVVDMDFERDYLKISSVDGNQDMASVLWGRTDDYVSHGMQYEYNGDPDADILVPVIDIVEPENSGIGFTYQNNATTRFNSVRYEGNPITNTTITYRAATTPWLLSSLDSNDSRNEFIFMMLRWFDKPENRIEARINDVDLWISDDHPQLGSGYVIQATVHNTGGASGNVLVRFMDGNTQIGSQSVTVAPGGKTTAEMIWVPLFAGPRTITILLDPIAEVDEIFEWSNNNATINTIVYFFWDDMESGTSKWSHSSTVLLINGEDALEYFHDTVLDTNIISEWNYTQSQNITNCTDLTFYYSHDTSYWFQEPEGNASGSSSNETRASTGGEKVLYTEIFYETFPNADGTWDGSADTAQNELGWDTAQGLGDNDVRVEDIDIAAGTIPPSGNNHLTFNDADQGAAPANPNDWAWVQIDLSGYTNCTLEYYWQDQASDAGEGGRVDYSTNAIDGSSGTWTNINTHINQDENDWYRETFVIPDIAAVATFSLRLSAYSNQNQENFLFDDIKIYINIRPDIPTFISHGANTTALGGETADETPSLNWNYSDIDGDLQQYYDVRVYDDATGIMTWSSGIIASPDHNVSVGDVGVPLGATLTNGEKYYWECLVSDGYAWSSIGGGNDTWEFTVNVSVNMPPDLPFNPSPTDWSGGAPTNLDLFWQCNDPDNDTLSYDVYLDLVNPPIAQVAAGLINITSLSQSLEPDTIYFWYVVVSDPYNAPVIGDIWVFATTGAGGGGVGVNWSALGRATDTININKTAVTQTMDLSNLESAKLSFWHKYSLLTGLNGAFLQVGYRDDTIDSDGDLDPTNDWDWKYITPSNAYTGNLNSSDWVEDDFGTRVYWCWNGVSARGTFGWDYIQVNLLNYVPEADRDEVRVKFNYIQWGEGTGYGWYIDDVRVTVSRSNSINPDSSTQDIWNYTTADAHSGNYSWSNVDPDTGLVKPGIDNYLMTTPIDLTNAKNAYISAYVKFNLNYQSGAPPDGFRVEITKDNGVTWEAVNLGVRSGWNISGTGDDAEDDYDGDGKAYTGLCDSGDPIADSYWVGLDSLTRINIDLTSFSGNAIQIRFRMATNGHDAYLHSNNDPIFGQNLDPGFGGFWVDDVIVYGETILT